MTIVSLGCWYEIETSLGDVAPMVIESIDRDGVWARDDEGMIRLVDIDQVVCPHIGGMCG